MAIKLTSTKKSASHIKCLVYGKSGIGKTRLASTAPKPVIISSEKKLLSLKDFDIPVILVENHLDLKEAYDLVTSEKGKRFETVVLDSISDIGEAVLAYFKENPEDGNTHPQAKYGSLADHLLPLMKDFRDIPDKHVYFIAKSKRVEDDYTGVSTFQPMMPGQALLQGLPYLFDFVFPMRSMDSEEEGGDDIRYLQTVADIQWIGKGIESLNSVEPAHLGKLFEKVLGGVPVKKKAESKPKPKKEKEKKPEPEQKKAEEEEVEETEQGFEEPTELEEKE